LVNGDYFFWPSSQFFPPYGGGMTTDVPYVVTDVTFDCTQSWCGFAHILAGTPNFTFVVDNTDAGSSTTFLAGGALYGAGLTPGISLAGVGNPLPNYNGLYGDYIQGAVSSEHMQAGWAYTFNLKTCPTGVVPCTPSSGGTYVQPTIAISTCNPSVNPGGPCFPHYRANSQPVLGGSTGVGYVEPGTSGGYIAQWHATVNYAAAFYASQGLTTPSGITMLLNDTNYRMLNSPRNYVNRNWFGPVRYDSTSPPYHIGTDARYYMQSHF
jgi:hypothetical protein